MKKYCPSCHTSDLQMYGYPDARVSIAQCNKCGWSGSPWQLLKELPCQKVKLKYVSIDIETTGLDPDYCQVLELGAVIEDWVSPIANLPTFRHILKYDKLRGEAGGLAMNAKLLKQPATCLPENLGYEFSGWLQENGIDPKHVQAAGKIFASFDAQFLKRVPGFSELVRFHHRTIDPCMLFWQNDDESLPDTKTCMKRAGITGNVAHTAVEDALAVIKMIRFAWRNK